MPIHPALLLYHTHPGISLWQQYDSDIIRESSVAKNVELKYTELNPSLDQLLPVYIYKMELTMMPPYRVLWDVMAQHI